MLPKELNDRVIASPDDDAPRLVLADMLQEAGDPRGELIAVQCALASAQKMTKTKCADLKKIEKRLLAAHGREWKAEVGLGDIICDFRRGFIETVDLSRHPLDAIGDAAWAMSPIRDLKISTRAAFLALPDHPIAPRLEVLNLTACEVGAGELARLPKARLRALMLWNDTVDADMAAVLSEWIALRELTLAFQLPTGAESIHAVTRSQALVARLVSLTLREGEGDASGQSAHHVAAAPWKALSRLELVRSGIDDDGAEALAAANGLAKLEVLNLAINGIRDRGVMSLAASPVLSSALRSLELSFNEQIGAGAAALAVPTNLPFLQDVDLRYVHHLGSDAIAKLQARFGKRFIQY